MMKNKCMGIIIFVTISLTIGEVSSFIITPNTHQLVSVNNLCITQWNGRSRPYSIGSKSISSLKMTDGSMEYNQADYDAEYGRNLDQTSSPSPVEDDSTESAYSDPDIEARMPKINSVTLSGRVGQDGEPRYFDDGKCVLNLSLAVKRKYHPLERKVKNIKYGEEETDWFSLELWGRDAEFASKYVKKGARIGITGTLGLDCWTDKNTGELRQKYKIIVKHFDVLETRAEAQLREQNQNNFKTSSTNYNADYRSNRGDTGESMYKTDRQDGNRQDGSNNSKNMWEDDEDDPFSASSSSSGDLF